MTVYVIDDHPLMREALEMLYERLRPNQVVISVARLGLLEVAIEQHGTPTLLSLDLKLPDTTGVSGIRQLKKLFPLVPFAIISASPSGDWESHCLEAGADIFIEKSSGAAQIGAQIRGLILADKKFEKQFPGQKLSNRQLKLLQLLSNKMSYQEISEELNIDVHAVKVHCWRLLRRMEATSRTQAIYNAQQLGLLTGWSAWRNLSFSQMIRQIIYKVMNRT